MNHIENQKIEGALAQVTLSQDAKYRIKNKVNAFPLKSKKHVGKKLSAATVISIVLASLIVITTTAVGLSLFKGIYGDKAETLTPYGITIGTSVQNKDVQLALHESVADEYATAYIFSIRGLTDAGKALVTRNTLDPTAYQNKFEQLNISQGVNPPEITDAKIYRVSQQTASGEFVNLDIGLRCEGVKFDVSDNASYVIIPIESLREENCEYYALYIITPEVHPLTLTFNGLEILLPKATTRIPGTEITFDGYIQDYFLTEGGMASILSDYPVSAVLTPLGLYVNDKHAGSTPVMYRNAVLTFTDGSEKELSEIANDKAGVVSWKTSYFPTYYQGAVYLFNEIMDTSTVKSLLFYGDIEFPFDGSTPFVRSSGRVLNKKNAKVLLWDFAENIRDYVIKTCPDPWTVTDPVTNKVVRETGWGDVAYMGRSYDYLYFTRSSDNDHSYFVLSLSDPVGGSLEDEVRAKTKLVNLNVLAKGTYEGTEVLAIDYGKTGYYKQCIYALFEGKLYCIEYNSTPGQPTNYAFDALLKLIKK